MQQLQLRMTMVGSIIRGNSPEIVYARSKMAERIPYQLCSQASTGRVQAGQR